MELNSVFQILLSQLNYVSLPGLGSFVKHYQPAKLSADGKFISAPREYFSFDASRNFNDEALETYLHEVNGITTFEASEQITNYINDITIQLTNGKSIDFEGIGRLQNQADSGIVLVCNDSITSSQTYGLQDINVEPRIINTSTSLAPPQSNDSKPKVKITRVSNHSGSDSSRLALIVASCVAIAVIVLIFTQSDFRLWEDSSLNKEVGITNELENLPIANNSTIITDTVSAELTPTHHEEEEISPIEISTDKKSALYYKEKAVDTRTHYIIVGSFSQKNNATKLFDELTSKGYKPNILEDNNSYRVSLYKFTNRDRALRELERLKSQNISKTVWLYSI